MPSICRRLAVAVALVAASVPMGARAGDFVDTRVTLLFTDDNVLAGPGETTPSNPGARFGSANSTNTQFYDNFNTKYSGFESLSNLVLYKKAPAFFEGLTTEAALALNLLVSREKTSSADFNNAVLLSDASSYVSLKYTPKGWNEREGVTLTGFPLSADRFRLGYAYKISWGGSEMFPGRSGAVPGAKLQYAQELAPDQLVYGYVGMKSTIILNDEIHEQEANYGVLAGAGVDITRWLRFDLSGGWFMKGVNPQTSVLGAPVRARGLSSQLVYHHGAPVGSSVDFALYKNDPDLPTRLFKPEAYPGGFSMTAALEGSYLEQTLADPDVFGQTTVQSAFASALQLRAKYDFWRFNVLALVRSLSFVQFNVPGFPPFVDFPEGTELGDEKFIAVGFDYYFERLHLTPGLVGGVQMPATYSSSGDLGGNNPPPANQGQRTVVVRDVNTFVILPSGADVSLIYSIKGTMRWDLSEYFAVIGELFYNRDNNRYTFKDDAIGVSQPTREKADILGFNMMLQARF
ncbi:MAG: hypothetical protein HY901_04870 [Deltaproteobacteria bacterium]|nr:hypothetical protein [Deltaproteobacteria bacterium]